MKWIVAKKGTVEVSRSGGIYFIPSLYVTMNINTGTLEQILLGIPKFLI